MSYQSLTFLLFSFVCLVVYYTVGKKRQQWVLAVANIIFFCFAGVKYLPFVTATITATYFCGKIIGKIYDKTDLKIAQCTEQSEKKQLRQAAKKDAKKVLVATLIVVVGLLAVCKYTGFFLGNINSILSIFEIPQITAFNMILPIGISFYTFMAISYVLDVYWKRYKPESNFITYAAFASYFPHVVQGPIDRFNEFNCRLKTALSSTVKILHTAQSFVCGAFLKSL